jgi:hypothetical protein
MSDFSIEANQERITDHRTKQYFAEVYSSYTHGNYRSAVVMLWSVVVCDLLFKLDHLKTLYTDATADSILTEIEDLRKKNPKSPEWEWELVEKVRNRTHLLEAADYVNLQALRDHRHLSAHPVLSATDVLFAPSKEQCRAHIRNALEGLLTKPPIMTKKVFDALMEDIEQNQAVLPDDDSLRRYLQAKYWTNLTAPVENSLVRSLWRLVFKSTDLRCEQNRSINYRTFRLFYKRRPTEVDGLIQSEPAYYSELAFSGTPFGCLLDFLSYHPAVFSLFTEAAKAPVRSYVDTHMDAFVVGWFLSANINDHIAEVSKRVQAGNSIDTAEPFAKFYSVAKSEGHQVAACQIAIALYGQSGSYYDADFRCQHFILPYLDDYDSTTMTLLLQAIEGNNQTYGRRQSSRDHRLVNARADAAFGAGWNINAYPNFAASI